MKSPWHIETETPSAGLTRLRIVGADNTPATVDVVLHLFESDATFVDAWCETLSTSPLDAYCWECPPLHAASLCQPFQCVLVESPLLRSARPDPVPFAEHFHTNQPVAVFSSLRKDATLIAPCPRPGGNFAHLASFLRTADPVQMRAFWGQIGSSARDAIGREPVWLSTAGLGVSWLHVRLDTRPKYYRYAAYREQTAR